MLPGQICAGPQTGTQSNSQKTLFSVGAYKKTEDEHAKELEERRGRREKRITQLAVKSESESVRAQLSSVGCWPPAPASSCALRKVGLHPMMQPLRTTRA